MQNKYDLIVYTSSSNPRLDYIIAIFFTKLLYLKAKITSDKDEFTKSDLGKINYSTHVFACPCFTIIPHGLLAEKRIRPQTIYISQEHDLPVFFQTGSDSPDLSFDVLAMSFYLLTRYEEYLPFEADQHGRFTASQSLAYKEGFLETPLVNCWAKKIGELLQTKFSFLEPLQPWYQSVITYDIDIAWAYWNRSFFRTIGGIGRDLIKNPSKATHRIKTFAGKKPDPFDTFAYIDAQHTHFFIPAQFFFLLGEYGQYDKNIHPDNPRLQQLIKAIKMKYHVGIHPSYASNDSQSQLQKEVEQINAIIHTKVSDSRQHFLKLTFPKTYQQLIELGIQRDYTMGYAEAIGFRASMACPFLWFDLEKNESTDLTIYPFQVMDVTLKRYMKLDPETANQEIKKMITACKAVGGTFIPIWHNSSLSDLDGWGEWRSVYEKMLKESIVGT